MDGIFDLDTMVGVFPRKKADISLERLKGLMATHGVSGSCLISARGVFYDSEDGNNETLSLANNENNAQRQFVPVGTVDLRNFDGNLKHLHYLRENGVRIWRLFPEYQQWDLSHPGFQAFSDFLDGSDNILYLSGKISQIKSAVGGRKITVIVDTHFYDFTDTLLSLKDSDGFYLATRRLHGPKIIRKVRDEYGAAKMCFASGSPQNSLQGALNIVRGAELDSEETAGILGGNLSRLLGERENEN